MSIGISSSNVVYGVGMGGGGATWLNMWVTSSIEDELL